MSSRGSAFGPVVPALPLTSGVLLALSFPPLPTGVLSFVALAPFAVHLAELPPGRSGSLQAARSGVWTGVVFHALLLHWMAFALPGRPGLGAMAYLTAVAVLALGPALVGWIVHRGVHGAGVPLWLAVPLAWTTVEWLRAHLPGGLAFPWAGLALTLSEHPRALWLGAWTGELGVTFWIAAVGGLLAEAAVRARRRDGHDTVPGDGGTRRPAVPTRPARPALAALALAVLPPAVRQPATAADGPTLRVAVVQTAVGPEVRRDPEQAARAMSRTLERLLPGLEPGSVDLVVLPETAFPLLLEAPEGRAYLLALRGHAARLGAHLLVGALKGGETPRTRERVHNSVFLVDRNGVRARYDKRRLVPGVESAPLLGRALPPAFGGGPAYVQGRPRPPLAVGDVSLGTLVCYESAFAALARAQRRDGARVLVNVTNDGWFGGRIPGTVARAQHAAHLVLRAVEGRVAVVRSANGGVSMVVEPSGRMGRRVAPAGAEAVAVVVVPLASGPTPFVVTGDLAGPTCALAAFVLLLASLRRSAAPGPRQGADVA